MKKKQKMTRLYSYDDGHYYFGFEADEKYKITSVAPCAKWLKGKSIIPEGPLESWLKAHGTLGDYGLGIKYEKKDPTFHQPPELADL